jgi:hypothetical protein
MNQGKVAKHPGYPRAPGLASNLSKFLPLAILLVSNVIPLVGVLYWGWDIFVLLMLYWMETLIIAFWTLLRILIAGDFAESFLGEVIARVFMFAFFLVHSGGFMLGHFIFLWAFFGKEWLQEIPVSNSLSTLPLEAFWNKMVIANGLLIPLAVSFVARGIAFAIEMSRVSLWKRLVSEESPGGKQAGGLVGGLYVRIVIMHLVVIVGAILAQKFGAIAPLILLIVVKTVVDLWFMIRIDLKDRPSVRPA